MTIRKKIISPNILALSNDHFDETINFISTITEECVEKDQKIEIILTNVQKISAQLMVLLFSTISHARLLKNEDYIIVKMPSRYNSPVYLSFYQSGLMDALDITTGSKVNGVRHHSFFNAASCDSEISKTVEKLVSSHILTPDQTILFSAALVEAIYNVDEHAYSYGEAKDFADKHGKIWWQCAWTNKEKKQVNLIVHDMGVGIQGTYKADKERCNYTSEQLLHEAMIEGYTSTGKANRGRGSEDIKLPIDNTLEATDQVMVISSNAYYIYTRDTLVPTTGSLKQPIRGTMIHWVLKFSS